MQCSAFKYGATIILLAFALAGCGGGGGGAGQTAAGTAPAIFNLQYTPNATTVNTVTSVGWRFDFSDPDGDVSTGTYTVYNPSGAQVFSKTITLTIPSGKTVGTYNGTTTNVMFLTPGTYTARMYLTDSAGSDSNSLTATFNITQ
ncbi:hypothetical protein LPW11_19780 [Geomonas sp. RF6]|uniref:hypothetical protein n=1 Tax=Geomonas sp. RF6 TaxID=2897342 RepID=UPI001E36E839|nr:hypothetical protein [Geomonas sp. RF6]UFS70102.1 hypothetical protein LPW11_19780 [Geomonas sp. RF6]